MNAGRLDPTKAACLLLLSAQAPLANANAVTYQQFVSVQMNVDAGGRNVTGDAAHEPTIAQDPNNPSRLVAGWKQFATVASGNRQGGWAYSDDGGLSWHFPGVVTPGEQRTNIMVDVDSAGDFYYQNLHYDATGSYAQDVQVFKSTDGGISWDEPVYAYGEGADKGRIGIDRSGTSSDGHVYLVWREGLDDRRFTRSSNGGVSFEAPVAIPESPAFGTIAVGPAGQTYVSGRSEDGELVGAKLVFGKYLLATSLNARDPAALPSFTTQTVDMGGSPVMFQFQNNPNQYGPPGDLQVHVDQSDGPLRGNIYLMSSVDPAGVDNQDVKFIRSSDGGLTWSAPIKVNDDIPHKDAYQWFAMQGVAPNGRIDAVWYDTRDNLRPALSRLYYSYSWDGGLTWSKNRPVTPVFNTHIAYPRGAQKLGDYTHLVSDALGAHVAYSATYNGEQDVYYLNVYPDCNDNGVSDVSDIKLRRTGDINANHLPDSCEHMAVPGDLDADKDVDKQDLNALLALRNRPARGSEDPADLDRNGIINLLDVRRQVRLCTRVQCAIQ